MICAQHILQIPWFNRETYTTLSIFHWSISCEQSSTKCVGNIKITYSLSVCIIIHNFLWTSIIYLSTFWLKYHHEITKKQQYPKILRNSIFLHVSSGPYSNYSTLFIYTYTFIWYFVSVIELTNLEDNRNNIKNKHIKTMLLHVHFYIFLLAGVA